jgi:hypothetical protein
MNTATVARKAKAFTKAARPARKRKKVLADSVEVFPLHADAQPLAAKLFVALSKRR